MPNHEKPGFLSNLRIKRVALVDVGANLDKATGDGAHIMLYKRAVPPVKKDGPSIGSVHADSPDWDVDDQDEYEKADLTGEGRRALPDSAFAAVWTDAQGKKHRKLPIHDAGHLAAARGRIDAADIPADVKAAARHKIESASATSKEKPMKTVKEVMKGMLAALLEPDAAKRELAAKAAGEALDKIDEDPAPKVKKMDASHLDAMKMYAKSLSDTIKAFGDGPHDDTHPVHSMKRQYDDACTTLKAGGCDITEGTMKMDPEVSKRLDAVAKENADLRKSLTEQIDKGIRAEVHTVLKSFRCVPLKLEGDDNDVDRYVEMYKGNKGLYDRQIALFKATDSQLATSTAFRNVGKGGSGGDGDAWARIEAEADKLMEKAAGKELSKAQAIDRICNDPAFAPLVKQYREQQQ